MLQFFFILFSIFCFTFTCLINTSSIDTCPLSSFISFSILSFQRRFLFTLLLVNFFGYNLVSQNKLLHQQLHSWFLVFLHIHVGFLLLLFWLYLLEFLPFCPIQFYKIFFRSSIFIYLIFFLKFLLLFPMSLIQVHNFPVQFCLFALPVVLFSLLF